MISHIWQRANTGESYIFYFGIFICLATLRSYNISVEQTDDIQSSPLSENISDTRFPRGEHSIFSVQTNNPDPVYDP